MSDDKNQEKGENTTPDAGKIIRDFIRKTILSMDGFTRNERDMVRAKDVKRGLVSLAKEFAIAKLHLGNMNKDIEEIKALSNSLKQSLAMLSRNDVLIQTITANVVYELLGRQDEWNESYITFESMEKVEEDTPGAVGIRVSKDSRIQYVAQERRENPEDEITYRVVPTQFLNGIKFHAVQAFLRKKELEIRPGGAIYLKFLGSEDFIDLIPEDYVDIDKRIDAAAEEVNEWADEYEKDGAAKSVSKVGADDDARLSAIAEELYPDGVDSDGEPVDMELLRTAISGTELESSDPATSDIAEKINEVNNGERKG